MGHFDSTKVLGSSDGLAGQEPAPGQLLNARSFTASFVAALGFLKRFGIVHLFSWPSRRSSCALALAFLLSVTVLSLATVPSHADLLVSDTNSGLILDFGSTTGALVGTYSYPVIALNLSPRRRHRRTGFVSAPLRGTNVICCAATQSPTALSERHCDYFGPIVLHFVAGSLTFILRDEASKGAACL